MGNSTTVSRKSTAATTAVLARSNSSRNHRRFTNAEATQAVSLYLGGMTAEQVAHEMHRTLQAMQTWLSRAGVTKRTAVSTNANRSSRARQLRARKQVTSTAVAVTAKRVPQGRRVTSVPAATTPRRTRQESISSLLKRYENASRRQAAIAVKIFSRLK